MSHRIGQFLKPTLPEFTGYELNIADKLPEKECGAIPPLSGCRHESLSGAVAAAGALDPGAAWSIARAGVTVEVSPGLVAARKLLSPLPYSDWQRWELLRPHAACCRERSIAIGRYRTDFFLDPLQSTFDVECAERLVALVSDSCDNGRLVGMFSPARYISSRGGLARTRFDQTLPELSRAIQQAQGRMSRHLLSHCADAVADIVLALKPLGRLYASETFRLYSRVWGPTASRGHELWGALVGKLPPASQARFALAARSGGVELFCELFGTDSYAHDGRHLPGCSGNLALVTRLFDQERKRLSGAMLRDTSNAEELYRKAGLGCDCACLRLALWRGTSPYRRLFKAAG